jgi:hypothetical protein
VALTAPVRSRKNCSFGSNSVSPTTFTVTVVVRLPAMIVAVPLFDAKSAGEVAVSGVVVQVMSTFDAVGLESVMVNVNGVVPALPSLSDTSSMETVGTASSFRIVPCACGSAVRVAFTGVARFTKNVSSGSNFASGPTAMVIVVVVVPGVNVAVSGATTGV